MKSGKQKSNWFVDGILFTGFLIAFFLDLTGVPLHQWLGIFIGTFCSYHLLAHWTWVKAVTRCYFGSTSGQARPSIPSAISKQSLQPARMSVTTGRRDFLKLMGVVGAAALIAASSALNDSGLAAESDTSLAQ